MMYDAREIIQDVERYSVENMGKTHFTMHGGLQKKKKKSDIHA